MTPTLRTKVTSQDKFAPSQLAAVLTWPSATPNFSTPTAISCGHSPRPSATATTSSICIGPWCSRARSMQRPSHCSAPAGLAPLHRRSDKRLCRWVSGQQCAPTTCCFPRFASRVPNFSVACCPRRSSSSGEATNAVATTRLAVTTSRSAFLSARTRHTLLGSHSPSNYATSRASRSACSATAPHRAAMCMSR